MQWQTLHARFTLFVGQKTFPTYITSTQLAPQQQCTQQTQKRRHMNMTTTATTPNSTTSSSTSNNNRKKNREKKIAYTQSPNMQWYSIYAYIHSVLMNVCCWQQWQLHTVNITEYNMRDSVCVCVCMFVAFWPDTCIRVSLISHIYIYIYEISYHIMKYSVCKAWASSILSHVHILHSFLYIRVGLMQMKLSDLCCVDIRMAQ